MQFNRAVIGVALTLFAIAEILHSSSFPQLYGQNYGPSLFPVLVGAGLLVTGVILIAQGIAERARVPLVEFGEWSKTTSNWVDLGLVVVALLFYIFFSDLVGFVPASLLILTVLLTRFGMRLWISVSLAVVVTVVIQLVFANFLLVPLPGGLLSGIIP